MKPQRPPFVCTLTKTERLLGAFLLPVHVFLLPVLLSMLLEYWPTGFSAVQRNTLYFAISFVLILLLMRSFLRKEWDRLCDYKLPSLLLIVPAHLLCVFLSFIVIGLTMLLPEELSALYDQALTELSGLSGEGSFTLLVLLVPIVEETLFRGLVFGTLREKNRLAAYLISALLYVICAVWQYAVRYPNASILFYAMQELPMAFALAWCYERSGTLWSPILYHAAYNLIPSLMG